MFEELKQKIGFFIFERRLLKKDISTQNFNNFIKNSKDYIFILPLEDKYFAESFETIKYFQSLGKNVALFLPDHKVNSHNIISQYKYIAYNLTDLSKLGLPSKAFSQKLSLFKFDVLIDLQPTYDLFLSAAIASIKAEYKVGIKKEKLDNLYNINLINSKNGTEISYKNLLNSLKMF